MNEQGIPVLYAIVTGSTVAANVGALVDLAQGDGWDVCVIASPEGRRFIDVDELVAKTGHPVRSQYKDPGAPDALPPADGIIVAPITSNSLAKWATGISDTLPLGLLVEAVGLGLPVVAVPFVNRALLSFPPIGEAVRKLSQWGVTVLSEDPPHEPKSGGAARERFPWEGAWRALHEHPRFAVGK
ncbi:flavoprotein [Nocardia sp. alder85J]|uniref:flavoprotein n=1 Tax=Nocardia sp. alder85J TaxID=2862949 RepID=UPI001CD70743|nr:flavoprotein [Nocardia sp. alder85J]MCX4096543.1 flavoprotein [Nocardia sp. alder85J]